MSDSPVRGVSASRWSFRTLRLFRCFVIALRLVVGVTAVQITGIPHVVADVVAMIQGDGECSHDDCPNDNGGRECPPGCPSCHCTHVMSVLPILGRPLELDLLTPFEIAMAPYEAQGPPGPDLAALYRPPRTAAHS